MKTLSTKDWVLDIPVRYLPREDDQKVSCWACRGRGVDIIFGETTCSECSGNGFRYDIKVREPKPEVPKALVEALRKTYKQYLEGEFKDD